MTILRCLGLFTSVVTTALLGCQGNLPSETANSPAAPLTTSPAAELPVVTVTPKAAAMIKQHVAELRDEIPNGGKLYLRVRVVPGGCQGFMHKLDLDLKVSAENQVCESGGVSVVTFRSQGEMLRGTEVDFGEENGKQGFKVENPNFKGEDAKKWLAVLEREKDVR